MTGGAEVEVVMKRRDTKSLFSWRIRQSTPATTSMKSLDLGRDHDTRKDVVVLVAIRATSRSDSTGSRSRKNLSQYSISPLGSEHAFDAGLLGGLKIESAPCAHSAAFGAQERDLSTLVDVVPVQKSGALLAASALENSRQQYTLLPKYRSPRNWHSNGSITGHVVEQAPKCVWRCWGLCCLYSPQPRGIYLGVRISLVTGSWLHVTLMSASNTRT